MTFIKNTIYPFFSGVLFFLLLFTVGELQYVKANPKTVQPKHNHRDSKRKRTHRRLRRRVISAPNPGSLGSPHDPDVTTAPTMEIGMGYDSASAEIKPTCIKETEDDLPKPRNLSQEGWMKVYSEKEAEDLKKQLGLDVRASFGIGMFSADATVNYFASDQMSRYGSYAYVYSFAKNRPVSLTRYTLTDDAKAELNKSREHFRQRCGDYYVAGKVTGGEFLAIIRAESTNEKQRRDLSLKLVAAAFTGSASVKARNEIETMRQNHKVIIEITRKGPSDDFPEPTFEQVVTYARSLPGKVKADSTAAYTVGYVLKPFQLSNSDLSAKQEDFFETESPYMKKLYARRASLTYIKDHNDEFANEFNSDQAKNRLNQELNFLDREIRDVRNAAKACAKDETKCQALMHQEIKEAPERPAWEPVDVTSEQPLHYGATFGNDYKAVAVRGIWYADCKSGRNGRNQADQTDVVFVNRRTGYRWNSNGSGFGPWLVPPNTDVRLKVLDTPGQYGDNCVDEKNKPLEITIFKPVYRENLSLPPGVHH